VTIYNRQVLETSFLLVVCNNNCHCVAAFPEILPLLQLISFSGQHQHANDPNFRNEKKNVLQISEDWEVLLRLLVVEYQWRNIYTPADVMDFNYTYLYRHRYVIRRQTRISVAVLWMVSDKQVLEARRRDVNGELAFSNRSIQSSSRRRLIDRWKCTSSVRTVVFLSSTNSRVVSLLSRRTDTVFSHS